MYYIEIIFAVYDAVEYIHIILFDKSLSQIATVLD
jgi:hypothetical protein